MLRDIYILKKALNKSFDFQSSGIRLTAANIKKQSVVTFFNLPQADLLSKPNTKRTAKRLPGTTQYGSQKKEKKK